MAITPTGAGLEVVNHAKFANQSDWVRNYVNDRVRKDLFSFPNFLEHDPDNLEGMDTGAPELTEIGTTGIGAPKLANNDSYSFLVPLPQDIDLNKDVDFRFEFSNSEPVDTGSYVPTMEYGKIVSSTTALVVASTALDVPFASQVDLAANIPQWTAWGTINAGKLSDLDADNDMLIVQITAALTTVADLSLLRGQMLYYRKTIA